MQIVGKLRTFEKVLCLSPSEYDVLMLLGQGLSTSQIAKRRGNSSNRTIDAHLENMKGKMEINQISLLRAYAAAYVYHCELFGIKRIDNPESSRFMFQAAA